MFKINFFALDWKMALVRYYLMMTLVILGGFIGQWWIALLGFPVFLSTITGMKIQFVKPQTVHTKNATPIVQLPSTTKRKAS